MNRYFVSQLNTKEKIMIEGAEFNHMVSVLREKEGGSIIICCNDGFDYICKIEKIEKSRAICSFLQKEENFLCSKLNITVFFGLLKGDKNEIIVQKLSELGIKTVVPFVSKNSTVKMETGKIDRLKKIATESAKQCSRSYVLKIEPVLRFSDIFKVSRQTFDEILLAYEAGGQRIENIENYKSKDIALIIGSEGGFTPEEVELAKNFGCKIITLGKRILRAETASIVFASIINYLCEEI